MTGPEMLLNALFSAFKIDPKETVAMVQGVAANVKSVNENLIIVRDQNTEILANQARILAHLLPPDIQPVETNHG